MAASLWKDVAVVTPADGDPVYVRRIGLGIPYEATWSLADLAFVLTNGWQLPWYLSELWRPR